MCVRDSLDSSTFNWSVVDKLVFVSHTTSVAPRERRSPTWEIHKNYFKQREDGSPNSINHAPIIKIKCFNYKNFTQKRDLSVSFWFVYFTYLIGDSDIVQCRWWTSLRNLLSWRTIPLRKLEGNIETVDWII